jgi:hypothetical protein
MWRLRHGWLFVFRAWQIYQVACAMRDGSYWRDTFAASYPEPAEPAVGFGGWGGDV